MSDSDWISLHLYYYDSLDVMLTGCIAPILERLKSQELAQCFFYVRYWQAGPHIRLRVLPQDMSQRDAIVAWLSQTVNAFFAATPSTASLDQQLYDKVTGYLSQGEYGEDRRLPLRPNNSLEVVPYISEPEQYGGQEVMVAAESHFMQSTAVALRALAHEPERSQLISHALTHMLLTLVQSPSPLSAITAACTAWLQGWGHAPQSVREPVERQCALMYERNQQQLAGLAREILAVGRSGNTAELSEAQRQWVSSLRRLTTQLERVQSTGNTTSAEGASNTRTILSILWRCAHMHNNRIGVLNQEEYCVVYLLARTLEDLGAPEIA